MKANTEKLRKLAEKNKQRVEEKRQQELRDRLKKAAEFEAENHHLLEQREAELNALEAQMKVNKTLKVLQFHLYLLKKNITTIIKKNF